MAQKMAAPSPIFRQKMNAQWTLDEALEHGVFMVPRAYSFVGLAAISLLYRIRYELFGERFYWEGFQPVQVSFS
jgi:hypothetical protein